MFSLIESKDEIAKSQRKLEATIHREFRSNKVKNIGYPGGMTLDAVVFTDGNYWYWSSDQNEHTPNPRRLNWFGLYVENSDLQISVEINIPHEGRNDQVAGFFARSNQTGSIYLFHSGRVGGGMKGVSKTAFLAKSNYPLDKVINSFGGIREGILVMPIEDEEATKPAIRYVKAIADFKQAVRMGSINTPEFQQKKKEYTDFYSESRGRRKGQRSTEIDYLSRHGEVVDALHSWRSSNAIPRGGRLVKNVLIDMGVEVNQEIVEVFEVKTSTTRSDIYTAIGQLMAHGTTDDCRRVMVLPQKEALSNDLEEALRRLNIEILRFHLGEKATIIV